MRPAPEDDLTGEDLRALRLHHRSTADPTSRISQAQLADWLGVTSNHLAKLERGELRIMRPLGRLLLFVLEDRCGVSRARIRAGITARRDVRRKLTRRTTR